MYSLYPLCSSTWLCAATSTPYNILIYMKKEVVITVRVEPETDEIIRSLAKKDDRTVAWVTRKLITEALEARKLLKPKNKK